MKKQKKLYGLLLSLLLACSLLFSGSMASVEAAGQGDMAVHFIDVGQGLAILVQSAGENLLYDGGDRSHANEVVEYLKNQQVDTIDYMISSHYDEDHLGGLVKCLDNFEVEHILGSDYVHTSELFNTFMNTATANGLSVEYPSVGDTYEFGTGSFTVMAPSGISKNSNDNSVVIRLANGNNGFLFMGDAEETSEQDMISTGKSLDCDVLCLGHHGSASSTSWDLLEASTPSWAVVSCGKGNSYGHPTAQTMEKLSDMNIPVFRTDDQGTVIAVSNGSTESPGIRTPVMITVPVRTVQMMHQILMMQVQDPMCVILAGQTVHRMQTMVQKQRIHRALWFGSLRPEASTTAFQTAER